MTLRRAFPPALGFLACLLFAIGARADDGGPLPTAEPASYSAPITISKGGTYTGNWQSTSDSVPAVYITTLEPVIIVNSHVAGTGNLISAPTQIVNLTVRNTSFHGHQPNSSTHFRGSAIKASGYKNLVVENNFFENTGIAVDTDEYSGDGTAQNTLTVRYNQVRNINGLSASGGKKLVQFVAAQNYRQPSGNPGNAEIAWNEVINTPYKSSSEDLINFFKAGGRADSWFKVHDNYLQGSYPADPAKDNSSGSGIIVDGPDNNKAAYIEAYRNIVVNTTNAGMNIAAGSNIWYHDNRVISTGKLPDGTVLAGSFGGIGIFNFYANDPEYVGTMHDIVVENNVVGWAKQGYHNPYTDRNDNPANLDGAYGASNIPLPDAPITQAMQDAEYQTFLQRVQAAGVYLGPRAYLGSNTPPTITAVADAAISEGVSTGPIPFTVGDGETAVGALTVTGSSSNLTLVPVSQIVFGGSGASRTVTVTPAAGQTGTAAITLSVSDGTFTVNTSFTITVKAPTPVVTSAAGASGQVGAPFNYQIIATHSPTAYTAGGLPAGLGVNGATGLISGTPTAAGTFSVTLGAGNAGGTGTAVLTLTVAATPQTSPVITSTLNATAVLGTPFLYEIAATNSPTSFRADGLPTNLSIDSRGVITGLPARVGTFPVHLTVGNAAGTGTATLVIAVIAAPVNSPVVTLTAPVPQVTAGSGEVGEFLLTRAGGDFTQQLLVNYAVKGTAGNGTDYALLKGTKKMKPGKTAVKIKVKPIGVGNGPGVKRVATLVLSPGDGYTVGIPAKAKVKIFGQ